MAKTFIIGDKPQGKLYCKARSGGLFYTIKRQGNKNYVVARKGDIIEPILPDDTTTYPMVLKGWQKYTITSIDTIGSNDVAYVDTNVNGKNPSTCFCSDYVGIVNTISLANTPDKSAKYGFTTASMRDRVYLKDSDVGTTAAEWNNYLASHPIDVLFELETSDNSLWFAIRRNETEFGYYNPLTEEFVLAYGMSGEVIKRVEYVESNGSQYITTDIHLTGEDSIEARIYPGATGRNTFGCYVSSSSDDNLCLYVSSSSSGSYSRYNGQVKRSLIVTLNAWNEIKLDKTGSYLNGIKKDTFTAATFTSSAPMYVMHLPNSSSSKFTGRMEYVRVPGKLNLIPVKVGTSYMFFDQQGWRFHPHNGTLDGGSVISEKIAFPEIIYQE